MYKSFVLLNEYTIIAPNKRVWAAHDQGEAERMVEWLKENNIKAEVISMNDFNARYGDRKDD